jgi:transposase
MQHITGEDRNQMFMISLESTISSQVFVRVIDAFVDAIDLKSFGFSHVECHEEGRPAYHPAALLKLYFYGYKYGIRSSRQLEREARLNMEAMWLLSGVHPKYHTIADFRRENKKAFRAIFHKFVLLLKEWDLIEGDTIAIDSFKIRAQNSLKNNYNEKKIERHIAYIDEKIASYEAQLDASDKEEDRQDIEEKIANQEQKKGNYHIIQERLAAGDDDQVSLTDPDAKAVILHRNIVNVGYNVQASVDAKNKLLVTYDTGDVNDTHALSGIAIESKELLQVEQMNAIADKGYHTGEEIQRCTEHNITTYVSPRASSTNNRELYPVEQFIHNTRQDHYTCPAGSILQTNGRWYRHSSRKGNSSYRFRRYTTRDCKTCLERKQCTGGSHNGRAIDRSEYAGVLESNTKRVEQNPDYHRQRQQLIEHIFGTLKRQRGFTHTLVKGKEQVLGEVGLMFIGYNLSRCVSILGIKELIMTLRKCCLFFLWLKNSLILSRYNEPFCQRITVAF